MNRADFMWAKWRDRVLAARAEICHG